MNRKLLPVACLAVMVPFAAHAADYYVKGTTLNVRLCPDADCPVKARLDYGDKVTVYEQKGDWARISEPYDAASEPIKSPKIKDGTVARWVSSKFLSESKPPKRPKF